jgi:DNA repair exonuclease SbcCD ATPase subunit
MMPNNNSKHICRASKRCGACKVVEQMFNLDPRAKDKVASLKHHIASLLDTGVDKRNNELNKNEAELDERNKKLDEKAAQLYKCTKELGEKEKTFTKLIEVMSLQGQLSHAYQEHDI